MQPLSSFFFVKLAKIRLESKYLTDYTQYVLISKGPISKTSQISGFFKQWLVKFSKLSNNLFCSRFLSNPLKYGFCKKSLWKNETLSSWTLLAHFFSRSAQIQCWSGKKVSQKCSTGQSFIFSKWHFTKSIF